MKNLEEQYSKYVKEWHASHLEGEPAGFDEWYDYEHQIELGNETLSKIAALNDAHRRSNPVRYMITRGVTAKMDLQRVISMVRSYDVFNEDNDPYGEHDFGQIKLDGETLFWKIDYYDQQLSGWCDPLSPDCHRVLTVMLAEEY